MAQRIIAACGGLATDTSPLVTAEAGALQVARNVIIDRPGVARVRPGISYSTRVSTSNRPRRLYAAFDNTWTIVSEWDGNTTWGMRFRGSSAISVPTGGAEPLAVATSFPQFVDARKNCYWTSKIGTVKVTAEGVTTSALAGMHEAPSGLVSTSSAGTLPLSAGNVRAYRWCFVKVDANGLIVRSAPGPWCTYDNTTAFPLRVSWQVPLPTYAVAGDTLELYASEQVPSGDVPADMLYLTATQSITAADITAGYATIDDVRTDVLLGGELYTNPTREGILKANGRPLASRAAARWSDCVWLGATVGPWTAQIDVVDVDGSVAIDGFTGLQRRSATVAATAGSPTLTGFAATTSILVGSLVVDGVPGIAGTYIPANARVVSKTATTVTLDKNALFSFGAVNVFVYDSITIDGTEYFADTANLAAGSFPTFQMVTNDPVTTARNLAYVISIRNGGGFAGALSNVFAYAVEDPFTNGYSSIVIRSRALDDTQWAITTTRPAAFAYQTTTAGAILVSQDNRPHRVIYSKPGEPEHFPELNFIDIGSETSPIVALTPLRSALLVFKTDGIYRITGSAPDNWRVDLLDSVLRPLRAECVDTIGDTAVVWTQRGVMLVDESGVQNISAGLVSEDLETAQQWACEYTSTLRGIFVAANNNDGYVIVGVPASRTAQFASTLYCWSQLTGAWTTWDVAAYTVREARAVRGFFVAKAPSIWEVSPLNYVGGNQITTGFDGSFSISGWTYSASTPSVRVTTVQRGDWLPKAGDWVSGDVSGTTEYRRITSVAIDGTDYVCTLASAFSASPIDRVAYEGIVSRIQWQGLTPGTPQANALWSELGIQYDWSRYTGSVGGSTGSMVIGAATNLRATEDSVTWSQSRAALLSDTARVMTPRSLVRASHLYPLVELNDIGLDWRILGVVASFEPTSERTKR